VRGTHKRLCQNFAWIESWSGRERIQLEEMELVNDYTGEIGRIQV
jgi:hypothetical protein